MRLGVLCMLLSTILALGTGARILVVLPFPGKSHFIFSSSVLKSLTDRGHQVVEYSPFPPTKPQPNYTHVEVHTGFEGLLKEWKFEDFQRMTSKNFVPGLGFATVWAISNGMCNETFKHENIKKLLNSNEHFDLVITESTFGQESMLVFGHRFSAPTITLQGFTTWSVLNRAAGNSLSIASIPDFTSLEFTDRMSFKERALNLLSTIVTLLFFYNYHLPIHQKIIEENYPGDAPPLVDMVTNVSLYILNSHPTTDYPRANMPNILPVAGISITNERTPLPKDIQTFMDEAKEGVIYFSFGTVVPLHIFPKEILQIFVNVFKKIHYKVIWKIELDSIAGLSKNVMLKKWVPQPGILAHPNCALFLTHGGINGQLEAISAGVPTVGIPFFGDQMFNIKFNEHKGIGVKLDFKELSEESLISALTTVLKTPRYKENARHMSQIFHDRPMSPADSVVYWVEYVLRHKGAHHLRSTAAQLAWYQLALLDAIAVVLVTLLVSAIAVIFIAKKILSLVLRNTLWRTVTTSKKKD